LTNSASKHDRVKCLERTTLPSPRLLHHCISDVADQRLTDLDAVHLFDVALNVPRAHPTRIHRQDFVIEASEPGLILLHQPRLELTVAVPGISTSISPKSPFSVFFVAPWR